MSTAEPSTVGLPDLGRFLLGGLRTALVSAIVLAVAAWLWSSTRDPWYAASAVLVANGSSGSDAAITAAPLLLPDYETVAVSDEVLRSALETSDGTAASDQAVEALRQRVTVRTQDPKRSAAITVTVRDSSASGSALTANAVADALIAWDTRRANQALTSSLATLSAQVDALEDQLRALSLEPDVAGTAGLTARQALLQERSAQLADLSSKLGEGRSSLTMLRSAVAPLKPASPSSAFIAAVAFLLGLFIGYGVTLARHALVSKVPNAQDLARLTSAVVVADMRSPIRSLSSAAPIPEETSSYLRALLELGPRGPGPHAILGSHKDSGHQAVALGIGISLARRGKSVIWIATEEGDLPGYLSSRIIADSSFDLADHLRLKELALPTVRLRTGSQQRLELIWGLESEPHASELASYGMARLLKQCAAAYDVVLVTASSPRTTAMPLIVAPHCADALLVVDLRRTGRDEVRESVDLIRRARLELVGVVATRGLHVARQPLGQAGSPRLGYRIAAPTERHTR